MKGIDEMIDRCFRAIVSRWDWIAYFVILAIIIIVGELSRVTQ